MPLQLEIAFTSLSSPLEPQTLVVTDSSLTLNKTLQRINKESGGQVSRAIEAMSFRGKAKSNIKLAVPANTDITNLVLVGAGDLKEVKENNWLMLGGYALGQLGQTKAGTSASIIVDLPNMNAEATAHAAAIIAQGALLRSYKFDKYQTKKATKNDDEQPEKLKKLVVQTADPKSAQAAYDRHRAIAEGVAITRDLVNEPANHLGPLEFAARCEELSKVGVEVTILDHDQLQDIGMHSLLAVAQGSDRPARVAVMQWHGAKSKRAKHLCFIGKGVVFDTGGVSMKPAGGMEDMKGDMGGAACVTGLMHALAARSAPVNAVGIVGLVENMVSGNAQRPGDIISSLSGQTIEVINTDAEGRLVLADLLTYAQQQFKPRFMVNLATLTGAILIALGKEHAGLFSNDDKLSSELTECGLATGEKVWRMPLSKSYDKMIDTPNADMKNVGGRLAGSITAAQFLQRFVDDGMPWAHLDVAGTAMASEKNDINQSWGSGWGVRLLDQLVAVKYEK
ncbi:MAG: leucyl aminopeptidase [Pseudomonadota bacterium]